MKKRTPDLPAVYIVEEREDDGWYSLGHADGTRAEAQAWIDRLVLHAPTRYSKVSLRVSKFVRA